MNSEKEVRLSRKVYFSSAHFYKSDQLSPEENEKKFGACYSENEYGHGHNYVLEVELQGRPDPVSGLVVNLIDVDKVLKNIIGELDHKHLNHEVSHFKTVIPTTENIALYLGSKLKPQVDSLKVKIVKLRLYEEEDIWVDIFL